MKKQQLNPPEINNSKTQNKSLKRRGVPGAVCDHIRLCHLFKEGDEESELRRYAVRGSR
jgi:peptide methionine sulfoxide reductase MsrB